MTSGESRDRAYWSFESDVGLNNGVDHRIHDVSEIENGYCVDSLTTDDHCHGVSAFHVGPVQRGVQLVYPLWYSRPLLYAQQG